MTINLINVLSQAVFFIHLTLFLLAGLRAHLFIIKEAKDTFLRVIIAYTTFTFLQSNQQASPNCPSLIFEFLRVRHLLFQNSTAQFELFFPEFS